jgi:hypothetical protein
LRSFTTALSAAVKPINVVAERATEPITSALQNVTVMRGIIQQDLGDFGELTRLPDMLANAFGPLLARVPFDPGGFAHDLDKFFTDPQFGNIRGTLDQLHALASTLAGTFINKVAEIDQLKGG